MRKGKAILVGTISASSVSRATGLPPAVEDEKGEVESSP